MIYPLQIRAARVLLGMTQQDLAKRSAVGLATVKRIEAAGSEITGTAQTMARIQRALRPPASSSSIRTEKTVPVSG